MASTLVGYFNDYSEAQKTERDLLDSGFQSSDVQVVAKNVDGMNVRADNDENWWDRFKSAFGFAGDDERAYYERAAQRGGALLTVRVPDSQTQQAAAIIERHNPVDIDTQDAGYATSGTTAVGTSADVRTGRDQTSESIPLAREELTVGKRVVQHGAVRVHTYVTETPVEEKVTLRDEEAFVERTPVNRAASAGEAAFQERTLEVRELGEEAVVSKQARVVEEVRVGKRQTAHTETVRDSVRKTEVEVDRDPSRDPSRDRR